MNKVVIVFRPKGRRSSLRWERFGVLVDTTIADAVAAVLVEYPGARIEDVRAA
jgi:hypothetical protein